ncbi:hypothetical protein HKX48_005749 [Thoreauomyces humboldtii]|nr:hypothetical protein HKX48_005749 [Thoreauomyces humboldtii]
MPIHGTLSWFRSMVSLEHWNASGGVDALRLSLDEPSQATLQILNPNCFEFSNATRRKLQVQQADKHEEATFSPIGTPLSPRAPLPPPTPPTPRKDMGKFSIEAMQMRQNLREHFRQRYHVYLEQRLHHWLKHNVGAAICNKDARKELVEPAVPEAPTDNAGGGSAEPVPAAGVLIAAAAGAAAEVAAEAVAAGAAAAPERKGRFRKALRKMKSAAK